ncbi:MAG TPA: hypothetical protein VG738_02355 [Chitinophagaceae bacterium]|nr:hypothetical protein [Chitinophagaceae bacterium]
MKKIYLAIFFLLSCTYICVGQPGAGRQKVEAIKIAYITKELNLSPAEAQRFWPVYNSYSNEVKAVREKYPNDEITFEEELVNIRKRYKPAFKSILVLEDRVNKVFIIEREFREMLRQEIKNRMQQKRGNY